MARPLSLSCQKKKLFSAFTLLVAGLLGGGCGSPDPATGGPENVDPQADEDGAGGSLSSPPPTAAVGQPARVTASSLNLRSEPSANAPILASMQSGTVVQVLATQGTWSQVVWGDKTGWCASAYLAAVTEMVGSVDEAMRRAQSGVGFSYYWGGGCWSAGAIDKGSCTGSCPSCSHSGTWGADCSGYVAKVWQIPGPSDTAACGHPYSTADFENKYTHWADVPRSSIKRGDALVYNDGSHGHIFLYDSGDAWGWMKAYEAKGCSYGILSDSRQASSAYKAIRRQGF